MWQWNRTRTLISILLVVVLCFYFVRFYLSSDKTDVIIVNEVDHLIFKKYYEQNFARREYLRKGINLTSYSEIYNILVPEVFCKNLIRIGSILDGGKWICNPTNMLEWPNCNIYSLGVNNDPSFEEDLQSLLNNKCNVRSVDKDEQSPNTIKKIKNINGQFKKALIGGKRNETSNTFTFNNILSEFGDQRIDILKIDIEGGEFSVVEEILSTPICQILIEVHGTPEATLKLLQTFSRNGFYLFYYEINGSFHDLCEYSFIHKNCLSLFNVTNILGKYLS